MGSNPMQRYMSLTSVNQYVFTCPIFNVDTKVAVCAKLDYQVMRGDKPAVRKGCQVCMRANLCPIRHLTKVMFREGKDLCFSTTPKKGPLPDEVIERIYPIAVVECHFQGINVSERERELIMAASGLSNSLPKPKGIKLSQVASDPVQPAKRKMKSKPVSQEVPSQESATAAAARSGDMSAAVNAAMEASG